MEDISPLKGENKTGNQNHMVDKLRQDIEESPVSNPINTGNEKTMKFGNTNDTLYSVPILVIDDEQDLFSGYE